MRGVIWIWGAAGRLGGPAVRDTICGVIWFLRQAAGSLRSQGYAVAFEFGGAAGGQAKGVEEDKKV